MDKLIVNSFEPDYAFPPGSTLLEVLEERELAVSQLASRSGLSEQQIVRLISGSEPLTVPLAAALEQALEIPASLWLNLEKHYRDFMRLDAERLRSA